MLQNIFIKESHSLVRLDETGFLISPVSSLRAVVPNFQGRTPVWVLCTAPADADLQPRLGPSVDFRPASPGLVRMPALGLTSDPLSQTPGWAWQRAFQHTLQASVMLAHV